MKVLLNTLLFIWQIPQNLLGLLFVFFLNPELSFDWNGVRLNYSPQMIGGISLGRYIVMRGSAYAIGVKPGDREAHEYGHCRQSMILGPLYLLVIGLPSLLWAAWWNEGRNRSYYSFYTERWADKLGGVKRC